VGSLSALMSSSWLVTPIELNFVATFLWAVPDLGDLSFLAGALA